MQEVLRNHDQCQGKDHWDGDDVHFFFGDFDVFHDLNAVDGNDAADDGEHAADDGRRDRRDQGSQFARAAEDDEPDAYGQENATACDARDGDDAGIGGIPRHRRRTDQRSDQAADAFPDHAPVQVFVR